MTLFRIEEVAHGSAAWRDTVRLREGVLRTPLGLAFDPSELAREDAQLHLALHDGAALAGTVVLVPPGPGGAPTWKLRQMAVAPASRRRGFGTALVRAAEAVMAARGAAGVLLHARLDTVPFYARLGYLADGAVFEEVTIPHRRMSKRLPEMNF